jgi:nicotinamide mononucleotide transporter
MLRDALSQFKTWKAREIAWLVFSLSAIVALSIGWGDTALGVTAAATGMLYTVLAGKGNLLCFVFGLVNTPLYATLALRHGYYGDFALNVYYFALMIPGLLSWRRHRAAETADGVVRSRLTAAQRLATAALCCAAVAALWWILRLAGGQRPLCDAVTNVLSIAAMLLTVRRAIEEWILWIVVDAVEVFMWMQAWRDGQGSVSILLMWLLFLANGIYLFSLWLGVASRQRVSAVASSAPSDGRAMACLKRSGETISTDETSSSPAFAS